jgi:DNA-binding XRE family transcriptional regulator
MERTKPTIAEIRTDLGIESQQELADLAGVVKSTVWAAENRSIKERSARKILKVLRERGKDLRIEDIAWNVTKG